MGASVHGHYINYAIAEAAGAHMNAHMYMQIMLQNTTATGKTAARVCAYAENRETVARLSLFWTIITGQGIEIPSLFVICRYSRCRYIR